MLFGDLCKLADEKQKTKKVSNAKSREDFLIKESGNKAGFINTKVVDKMVVKLVDYEG